MFRNVLPFDSVQREKYPYGYSRLRTALLRGLMLRSFCEADLVIFLARYPKRLIEEAAGGRLKNSVVIPHGVAPEFRRGTRLSAPPAGTHLPQRYFLYASSIDRYKAQIDVLRGYAELRQQRPQMEEKLVLLGPVNDKGYGRDLLQNIERLGMTKHVLLPGTMPYESMPAAYQGATANIFASESENCPNILLEAMAAGRPVICSQLPPMPDFGGDAVLYFDPANPSQIAAHLAHVLDNSGFARNLGEKALARSYAYDWRTTAEQTWRALGEVAGFPARDAARAASVMP